MPRWVLPSIILILLFLAFAFRWEEGPRRTADKYTVITYKHDRWLNQDWAKIYTFIKDPPQLIAKEMPLQHRKIERDVLTLFWFLAVTLVSIWLYFSIKKDILNRKGSFE